MLHFLSKMHAVVASIGEEDMLRGCSRPHSRSLSVSIRHRWEKDLESGEHFCPAV